MAGNEPSGSPRPLEARPGLLGTSRAAILGPPHGNHRGPGAEVIFGLRRADERLRVEGAAPLTKWGHRRRGRASQMARTSGASAQRGYIAQYDADETDF
jgi:hypothetical protein